jgi:Zn-dependent protease
MEDFIALLPLWYIAFLFSTVCHEAAHALVAKWGGDLTAYSGGHVTLDPIPHIRREPFGLLVMPLITLFTSRGGSMFGWGSAPFDPYWQIRYPRRAALMALAGPLTNFLLACVAAVCMYIGIHLEVFEFARLGGGTSIIRSIDSSGLIEGLATFLSILFTLNVILGAFNLLPFPPLDGYSVLGLFLPEEMTLKTIEFARSPGFSFFGIFLAYQFFPSVAGFVFSWALYLLYLPFLG